MTSNPLGCQCPGVPYLAGIALRPDVHWEMWADGEMDGPEPLATQEDGLCDGCRTDDGGCAKRAAERPWRFADPRPEVDA